ncbi:MAG: metalloregulator ArsR/SmtB family transcription factor [Sporolactobacillus sp.]
MEHDVCAASAVILDNFKQSTPIFQALGDDNRQQIVAILLKSGTLNVNQLTDRLHISRPAVSHHLKILRDAQLVTFSRKSTEKYYSLVPDTFLDSLKRLVTAVERAIES